jgi:hypothetical protein
MRDERDADSKKERDLVSLLRVCHEKMRHKSATRQLF